MTDKLRVGMIGTVSAFNDHFGHAIAAIPEMEGVAAATLGRSKNYIQYSLMDSAENYARKYKLKLYEDAWEMVEREGLQAVYLTTEDHLLAQYAIQSAKRGLHVFMHKPWATNLEDADAVIAAAGANHVVILPNLPRRFTATHVYAQLLVQAGVIGKPLMMHTSHSHHLKFGPWKSDPLKAGGAEFEVGFYDCDTHRMLMGTEPVKVYCVSANLQHTGVPFVDNLKATVTYDNGGFGSLSMYFGTDFQFIRGECVELVGEDGAIRIIGNQVIIATREGDRTIEPPPMVMNTEDIRNWVHACLGVAESKTSLEEGRKTLQFCMALRASSRLGEPVTLPLDDQPEVRKAARPYELSDFGKMPEPPIAAGVKA